MDVISGCDLISQREEFGMSDKIVIAMFYLLVLNIIGLAVMGIDKAKARHHAWRIPEKVLFLVSLLGGSIGTWAGMYIFRHKTKHWYFVIGMPAILLFQVAAGIWICGR
jgi:uncharacterized membrane protein YsdA (DUF1294 family)